jgi:8-oxo-dGTP diphosphatase
VKRYVVGFAFSPDDHHVVLIEKRRPAWQHGRVDGVGGHIEDGETPERAMAREFHEEAGIRGVTWTLFALLNGTDFDVWFYRGVTSQDPRQMTDERVQWVDADVLPANVLPNLRWLIPMARAAQMRDWPFRIVEQAGIEQVPA